MAPRILILVTFLLLSTGCREEQLSLPVTHAAVSEPQPAGAIPSRPSHVHSPRRQAVKYAFAPGESCYTFMLLRPKGQRAMAVQARLKQSDKLAAAFDSEMVSVDLVGDHANILSLEFSVRELDLPAYSGRISAVVEDYFSSPDVEDYMCNSGYAEVRLSALDLDDDQLYPLWRARVTSEGLLKVAADGELLATVDPVSLP